MSEIFEGVVTRGKVLMPLTGGFDVRSLGEFSIVGNTTRSFTNVVESIASVLSIQVGEAVLVRFDSRVGHRSSAVFINGEKIEEYGPEDELYVALDDEGDPVSDSELLRLSELQSDEEYETAVNAIERGLNRIGFSWARLREMISREG